MEVGVPSWHVDYNTQINVGIMCARMNAIFATNVRTFVTLR